MNFVKFKRYSPMIRINRFLFADILIIFYNKSETIPNPLYVKNPKSYKQFNKFAIFASRFMP